MVRTEQDLTMALARALQLIPYVQRDKLPAVIKEFRHALSFMRQNLKSGQAPAMGAYDDLSDQDVSAAELNLNEEEGSLKNKNNNKEGKQEYDRKQETSRRNHSETALNRLSQAAKVDYSSKGGDVDQTQISILRRPLKNMEDKKKQSRDFSSPSLGSRTLGGAAKGGSKGKAMSSRRTSQSSRFEQQRPLNSDSDIDSVITDDDDGGRSLSRNSSHNSLRAMNEVNNKNLSSVLQGSSSRAKGGDEKGNGQTFTEDYSSPSLSTRRLGGARGGSSEKTDNRSRRSSGENLGPLGVKKKTTNNSSSNNNNGVTTDFSSPSQVTRRLGNRKGSSSLSGAASKSSSSSSSLSATSDSLLNLASNTSQSTSKSNPHSFSSSLSSSADSLMKAASESSQFSSSSSSLLSSSLKSSGKSKPLGKDWEMEPEPDQDRSDQRKGERQFVPTITDSPLQMRSSRNLLHLANADEFIPDEKNKNSPRKTNYLMDVAMMEDHRKDGGGGGSLGSLSDMFSTDVDVDVDAVDEKSGRERHKLQSIITKIMENLPYVHEDSMNEVHERIFEAVKLLESGKKTRQ